MAVEPVPDAPAAVVNLDGPALVVADYHAGIEAAIRAEKGIELDSAAPERRERLYSLVEETGAERVVVLGDLMHSIGDPTGAERGEVERLIEDLPVPLTLVKGNHDGDVESWVDVEVTPGDGVRMGEVGFAHGHTWPAREVLESEVVCVGHEHPCVRLTDAVGGSRVERVWLRGPLDPTAFEDRYDHITGELVVFPAFNDLSGGTWVNVPDQEFLAPFLPQAFEHADAYLLDGTRLGDYRRV